MAQEMKQKGDMSSPVDLNELRSLYQRRLVLEEIIRSLVEYDELCKGEGENT